MATFAGLWWRQKRLNMLPGQLVGYKFVMQCIVARKDDLYSLCWMRDKRRRLLSAWVGVGSGGCRRVRSCSSTTSGSGITWCRPTTLTRRSACVTCSPAWRRWWSVNCVNSYSTHSPNYSTFSSFMRYRTWLWLINAPAYCPLSATYCPTTNRSLNPTCYKRLMLPKRKL